MTDAERPFDEAEVQEIEKRANAASPGPWESRDGIVYGWVCNEQCGHPLFEVLYRFGREVLDKANTKFMAHARADVPFLLAALRRERAAKEAAEREQDKYVDDLKAAERELARMKAVVEAARILIENMTGNNSAENAYASEMDDVFDALKKAQGGV